MLLTIVVVYGVNTLAIKRITDNWFVHSYLHDLLAMPCILAYSNMLIAVARRADLCFVHLFHIGAFTAVCSITWELGALCFKQSSVCDPWDLVAYTLGALGYWLLARFVPSSPLN